MEDKEIKEVAVVSPKKELVLEGDPQKQLAFAKKAADALMSVVKPKKIGNKDYLEFGGWQILGRFFGATVGIEWTKKLVDEKNSFLGYEARAVVMQKGEPITWAEASCLTSERNWKNREEFAIKSMAQTRASAKALRNAFGWVAELAGLASTPAEEMANDYDNTPVHEEAKVISTGDDHGEVPAPVVSPEKKEKVGDPLHAQKKEIKELIDNKALVTLTKKEEYEEYVRKNTGLELHEGNYAAIIDRLKVL